MKWKIKHHCGCNWKEITKEEYTKLNITNNKDLINIIVKDKSYMDLNTIPVLGTIISGINAGYQFVLYGGKEINLYGFNQPHVSKVCSGLLKSHGGCTWSKINSKEADGYPRGISIEIYNTLEHSKFSKIK